MNYLNYGVLIQLHRWKAKKILNYTYIFKYLKVILFVWN